MIHYLMIVCLMFSSATFGFAQTNATESDDDDISIESMSSCACEMPERNDTQRLCSPEINFLTHVQLVGDGNPRCHQPGNIDVSDPRCMSKVYTFQSTKVGGNLTIEISTPTDAPGCELTPLPGIKYAISGNHFQKDVVNCGEVTGADIVLIYDESGSIGRRNFNQRVIPFLIDIVKSVSPTEGVSPVNFAAVGFGSSARVSFVFKPRTSNQVESLLNSLNFRGGNTALGNALRLTANRVLIPPFDNDSNPNICIVVTDGRNNRGISVRRGANLLKRKCQTIFAVGIGNNVNDNSLLRIASDSDKAIRVRDITLLSETLAKEITRQICVKTGETKSVCNARNCIGLFNPTTHEEFQELKGIYETCSNSIPLI